MQASVPMFRPGQSLTFGNAASVLAQGLQALAQQPQPTIDMGALKTVDSSAVAVLLAWQRAARERQLTLMLLNLPANLHSLIALYGVDALLPDANAGDARRQP